VQAGRLSSLIAPPNPVDARFQNDYLPTGFKRYQVKARAVKGHPFGLELSPEDCKSLVALLKTFNLGTGLTCKSKRRV
jgi:hypothetical protein